MLRFTFLTVVLSLPFVVAEPLAAASDPSTAKQYNTCHYSYSWNGTAARIYHPTNGNCTTAVYGPLVILLHGAGYAYTDYDELLLHLARNGFIAVSIDVLGDNTNSHAAAVAEARAFMKDFLWYTWSKMPYINPGSVAIIGHSRGGGTAVHLAQALASPEPGEPLWNVRAIVQLAPVGHDAVIDGSITRAYLAIHGSMDEDEPASNSFRHYDAAGSDDSQFDPLWNPAVVYKSLKLLENGSHKGFTAKGLGGQMDVTKGYVLAFLRAHLHNDVAWYEEYIRGDAVPATWSTVVSQGSDGFLRRVIDHFEDGTVGSSTIGGVVYRTGVNAIVSDLSAHNDSTHQTHALSVAADNTSAHVTWRIPAGKRDVAAFKWLSLRIGQTTGPPTDDLRVQIRNGVSDWSDELRITDYGQIPSRWTMCTGGNGLYCTSSDDLAHMGTVRIPLSAFGSHDDVTRVRIRFRDTSILRWFLVDNLEFSEFIFKP